MSILLLVFSCTITNHENYIPKWVESEEWYSFYKVDDDIFYAKLKNDTLYYSFQGSILDTSLIQIINFEEDSLYYYLTELPDSTTAVREENKIKRYPYSCIIIKNVICLKLNHVHEIFAFLDDGNNELNLKNNPLFIGDIYLFPYDHINSSPEYTQEFIQVKLYGYSVGDTIRDWSNIDNHYSYCYLKENYSNLARFDLFNDSIIFEITGFDIERNGLNNIIDVIDKKYNINPQTHPIDTLYSNSKPYMRQYSWNNGNIELNEWIDKPLLKGWHLWICDYPVKYYLCTLDFLERMRAKKNIIE
jgi:hypothetical protein